jgi:hypothetical protein
MVHNLETDDKVFDVSTLMQLAFIQNKTYDYYLVGVDGYPGNTPVSAGGDIPRYLKPAVAPVIDIQTRKRVG